MSVWLILPICYRISTGIIFALNDLTVPCLEMEASFFE